MQCTRITRVQDITISAKRESNFTWTRPFGLLSTLDSNPQLPSEQLPNHSSPVPFELSTLPASQQPQLNADCDCESGREPDVERSDDLQPLVFEEDLVARVAQMVLANDSSEKFSHLTNGTLDEPEVRSPQGSCSPPHSPTSPTSSGSTCLSRSSNETHLRKKSAPQRRVSFADECGRLLATTHIFSEPSFLGAPPQSTFCGPFFLSFFLFLSLSRTHTQSPLELHTAYLTIHCTVFVFINFTTFSFKLVLQNNFSHSTL